MKVDQFFLTLLYVATPGLLCYFLLKRLIGKIGEDLSEKIFSIFLLSVLSYLLLDSIRSIQIQFSSVNFQLSDIILQPDKVKTFDVLAASAVSIVLSIILSYLYRYKIWNNFAKWIKATTRFGDEDVFNYLLDSKPDDINGRWIYVRDHKVNLLYYGYVNVWSETKEKREIVLIDVDVYSNENGDLLYSTDKVYISRNDDDITIEIPKVVTASDAAQDTKNSSETVSKPVAEGEKS
jgi:hypothetical protein